MRGRSRETFAALRGLAAGERASGFGAIAARYVARLAAARAIYEGDELDAAVAAIRSEQLAAEAALRLDLSGRARQRRVATLAAIRDRGRPPVAAYDLLRRAEPAHPGRPAGPTRRFRIRRPSPEDG